MIKKGQSMLKKTQFFTFFIVLCEKKEAVIKTLYNLTKIFIMKLNQYIASDSEIIKKKEPTELKFFLLLY